ncbi:MAG: hypothetical protein ACRD03_05580 [Acidimicrobiales bacterium]
MGRIAAVFRGVALVVAVALAGAVQGCGSERTGGPRGAPQEVVDAAPDRTVEAGGARFEAGAPDARRTGEIDFGAPTVASGDEATPYPELNDPRSVVDLVRGAIAAESYGGAAVRGASTFRYEAVVNVERAVAETPADRRPAMERFAAALGSPAFYVDLWIDDEGRLRRVQIPLERTTQRPHARSREMPRFLTVDFFDFAGPAR